MDAIVRKPVSAVVEFRQYTLKPGRRDELIDLFEREFVESQEDAGIEMIGQFRDRDRPDRFVWMRGFPDMEARAIALDAFYGGPVWRTHRDRANDTMLDSDDVLLLRPVDAGAAWPELSARAPRGASVGPPSRIVATVLALASPVDDAFRRFHDEAIAPVFIEADVIHVALLESESAPNTFPRLPVREGEHVLIRLDAFSSDAELREHEARLATSREWTTRVRPALERRLARPIERIVLQPSARSWLR